MAIVKDLFHFIFSFGLFMPVILWRNFVTSSWRSHSIFCTNEFPLLRHWSKFLKLLPYLRRLYSHVSWIFWNFCLQVSPFLHSFGPFFFSFHAFLLFPHFFAHFCLQNSRKYSKTLENKILVAQLYNTFIFNSKVSHSHIGENIILWGCLKIRTFTVIKIACWYMGGLAKWTLVLVCVNKNIIMYMHIYAYFYCYC